MKRIWHLHQDPRELPADFWQSANCEVLIIKRWAQERPQEAAWVGEHLPSIPKHVWIASSGTLAQPGQSKWVALSKSALLASAAAVNQHLSIRSEESWGLTLPLAHVGGLGIVARAHLLGQKISLPMTERWDAERMRHWQGQLLSLVPTQVHDLVQQGIKAPSSLRVVVVGGDRLSRELLEHGRQLGWPLFPSYGLTECCSQVATSLPGDVGEATLLPHITASTDEEGRLSIASPSLFTGIARMVNEQIEFEERTENQWATEDLAVITQDRKLRILGRRDSVVKVRGEKVDIPQLEERLQKISPALVVLPITDARDGYSLWVASEHALELETLNTGLLPHQKIRGVKVVPALPRNPMGKVKRGELINLISARKKT